MFLFQFRRYIVSRCQGEGASPGNKYVSLHHFADLRDRQRRQRSWQIKPIRLSLMEADNPGAHCSPVPGALCLARTRSSVRSSAGCPAMAAGLVNSDSSGTERPLKSARAGSHREAQRLLQTVSCSAIAPFRNVQKHIFRRYRSNIPQRSRGAGGRGDGGAPVVLFSRCGGSQHAGHNAKWGMSLSLVARRGYGWQQRTASAWRNAPSAACSPGRSANIRCSKTSWSYPLTICLCSLSRGNGVQHRIRVQLSSSSGQIRGESGRKMRDRNVRTQFLPKSSSATQEWLAFYILAVLDPYRSNGARSLPPRCKKSQ